MADHIARVRVDLGPELEMIRREVARLSELLDAAQLDRDNAQADAAAAISERDAIRSALADQGPHRIERTAAALWEYDPFGGESLGGRFPRSWPPPLDNEAEIFRAYARVALAAGDDR